METIVFLLILSSLNCLHMKSTGVHLITWLALFALRHFDVQGTCFIFIKQVIEFIVCSTIHSGLLVRQYTWSMMSQDTFVVS